MTGARCQATYTRQHWRLEHDEAPQYEELFDTDGRWECPREAVAGADRCPFHLSAAERERHGVTDGDVARRLAAELRGDRQSAPGDGPGELVGADLGRLVLSPDTLDGVDESGDPLATDVDTLYLVGGSLEQLVVESVTLGCDVALDGVEVSAPPEADITDEVALRDAAAGEVRLTATRVDKRVGLAGADTRLDSVRIGRGTHTGMAVSVEDDATVAGAFAVEGPNVGVSSVVVTGGAAVGTDGGGLTVTGVESPETQVTVSGEETSVGSLTLDDARLTNVFVQNGAAVDGAVAVHDATVTSNLKLAGAGGKPSVTVGPDSEVSTCVVENTDLREVAVEAGASVRAVKIRGGDTEIGAVQLEGGDTTLERLSVTADATVDGAVLVHEGATVKQKLTVKDARVRGVMRAAHPEAVVVRGAGTSVGTVAVDGADLEGLRVDGTTVDRVAVGDATVEPPPSRSGTDPGGGSPAVLVTDATVESSVEVDGGEVEGDVVFDRSSLGSVTVEGQLSLDGRLAVRAGTTVERSLSIDGTVTLSGSGGVAVEGARVLGDLVVTGGLEDAGEDAALRVVGDSVVEGALRVDGAAVDGVAVVDASVRRRLTVVGDATVEGGLALRRDAAVEGDLVVGFVPGEDTTANAPAPDGGDLAAPTTDTPVDGPKPRTTVEGGIELGDREDAHPTSGGVSVDGSVAVTGTAAIPGGITLSDVVVGEDLRVVGRTRRASVGRIDLFDCIVTGKVRVEGADVDALSLVECRVGESVWVGAVDTGRASAVDDDTLRPSIGADDRSRESPTEGSRSASDTAIDGTLSVDSTPVTEDLVVDRASLGRVRVTDATVDGGLRLATVQVAGPVVVRESQVGARATVGAGRIGGLRVQESVVGRDLVVGTTNADRSAGDDGAEAPVERAVRRRSGVDADPDLPRDLTVGGECAVRDTSVEGECTVDCRVDGRSDPRLAFESTDVEGAVSLRPRLRHPGRVSLRDSTLPAGELVVPAPADADPGTWYDLRRATLGDLSVGVEGDGRALDHILVLETRFDGFRFSELDGGVDASDGRLHTLRGGECASRLDGVESLAERVDPDRSWLYVLGELYGVVPWAGTGYDSDDPPPDTLEQTYLNAKNGASQVGDEDIAGAFFKREKRYRRRTYWEQLVGAADRDRGRLDTLGRWIGNAVFDRMAVFGESPGRVVTVSAGVIALFAGLFAVLLERPPYGDQYLENGLLPETLVSVLQPLTLSIESFVTLVLVGPADQRLTPLVHLLGQVEGFLGVFLVALFVFTLTRSVHR